MSITAEAKNEVERLLQHGKKIEAIKYLCDTFSVSLAESKMLVDAVEREMTAERTASFSNPQQNLTNGLTGELRSEVIRLIQANKKIDAIKYVKQNLGTSLKESVLLVEEVDKQTNPNYKPVTLNPGCFGNAFKIVGSVFIVLGLIFAAIVGLIYYYHSTIISNSDYVQGVVVDFKTNDTGGTAPVIEYELQGQKKLYSSDFYSTPPDYELNEKVGIYVSRENADDAIVDTFLDRWLIITIFGGIGGFFIVFGGFFVFAGRKF